MKGDYFRRRWLDFRNGHSIYLAFILTFVNFILITYNFAIKQVAFLRGIIDNLPLFVLLFIGIYIPASIIIGYWHRRNQFTVENEAYFQQNWIMAWIFQFIIRQIKGNTTPEETEKVLNYLNEILKRQKKHNLMEQPKLEPDTDPDESK